MNTNTIGALVESLRSACKADPLNDLVPLLMKTADALSTAAQPPAGWVMVPVEATEEMKAASVKYANGSAVYKNVSVEVLRIEEGIYGEIYEAMLAAAPKAVPTKDEEQAAFEEWLARTCPSGDVESVHRQWEQSSDYLDLHDAKAEPVQQPERGPLTELLDALSQHDDPCEDIGDALRRVRALVKEADRLTRLENAWVDRMAHKDESPRSGVLNVVRVALERTDMNHRSTGFKPFEIESAKAWVSAAIANARGIQPAHKEHK